MNRSIHIYRLLIVLLLILSVQSCSVEKNTNISRFYHNLTSNYNIYFNAYESFLSGRERISSALMDDYSTIMPVFEFSDADASRAGSSDMDRAVQKASKVISLHSMTAKPETKSDDQLSEKEKEFLERKDYNNWVDDSYLLMGKAQVYKHQFQDARITLLHNIRESHDPEMRDESTIWLGRAYSSMGNYAECKRLLTEMKLTNLKDALKGEYYLTLADMYYRQSRYEHMAENLEKALDYLPGKKNKARLTYILAKVYEHLDDGPKATENFKRVLSLNPPYEMEFNARISQAGVFDINSGDVAELRKELNKLLRDSKNKEYQDQIYFAHGNLSMREGDIESAIEYMKKSASVSSSNNIQKGRSYLVLAEYYFEEPDYKQSQVYYDSTCTFLNAEYPGYDRYKALSQDLNELVRHLEIIELEDSLQYVASLKPSQIDNIINTIIREIEEAERLAETETDSRYNLGQFYENQRRFQDNIESSGKWYFYNQSALTFGRTEFRNRWGDRQLEDNWRRRNKSLTGGGISGSTSAGNEEQADSLNPIDDIKSKEYYLKNLPLNDSLLAISNEKIAGALLSAAKVYDERFEDRVKASSTYMAFIERFPFHFEIPQSLYNLYQINKNGDPALAERHKSDLVRRFPESEYARILTDPDYFESKVNESKRAVNMYEQAYAEWQNENNGQVLDICDRAIEEFPDNELTPKFMLLRAYSLAKESDERTLKEELNKIITLYKDSEEAVRASELVAYLNREIPELKVEEEQQKAREIYDTLMDGSFTFIMVIKDKDIDINRATFDVINFNIDNYTNENYNTRGELVDDLYLMVLVSTFDNYETAAAYYREFDPQKILSSAENAEVMTFIISSINLSTLNEDKDPDRYLLFFRENFPDLKD